MTRYFVTGATGFLGGHVTDQLLAAGHEVVALCRHDEPELEDRGVIVVRGRLEDAASLERGAAGAAGVFHCAGKVSRKPEDAEELHKVHVGGTRAVLAASRAAGVKRVVVASTSGTVAVSEDPNHVATEADPAPVLLLSRWPYYRSKLYAEELALAENKDGLEVVSVNPTLLLGPGDTRGSSTEDVRLFLDRRVPGVPSGGLSYVDVRDAAAGMILAMSRGAPGQRYLLGACNLTVRELFARLERVSGVPAPLLQLPRMPAVARAGARLLDRLGRGWLSAEVDPVSFEMAQYYWYLDAGLAERELGWTARDPMTTLADTVRDLGERQHAWQGSWQARSHEAAHQRGAGHSEPGG
jgi:dihydroflavonol-4-reductase